MPDFARYFELFGVPETTEMVEITQSRAGNMLLVENNMTCDVYVCHKEEGRPVAITNCHANPRKYACCTSTGVTAAALTYGGNIRQNAWAEYHYKTARGYGIGTCAGGHKLEIVRWLVEVNDLRFFVRAGSRWAA